MSSRWVVLSCLFAASLGFGQRAQQKPAERPAETTPAPAPGVAEASKSVAPVDPRSYVIGAEDILGIQVWREPDLSRQVMVRPDGKITLPLVLEIQAAGLTPDKLTTDLAEAFGKFLTNPQVLVSVLQVNSKKFYITGEVNRPGPFPLVVPTRVLEALSQAGGFREFANPKKIIILRKGDRLKFNYKDVVKGKGLEQNIFIENGDYIIVP